MNTSTNAMKRRVAANRVEPSAPTRKSPVIKSADRAVDILEALAASSRPLTLTEIQRELNVPKSSLHGLLQTLVQRGWVQADERGDAYSVGLRALRIGASFLDRDPVVRGGEAVLAHLGREFEETMHLARMDGDNVVYLASRESHHHLRERSLVGRRLPVHATALGQAILSTYAWDDAITVLPSQLESLTARTITDLGELKAVVEATRERGWAHEEGQNNPGLVCVAVAIPLVGPSVDAVSCSIPAHRVTAERVAQIATALHNAARDLSLITGGLIR